MSQVLLVDDELLIIEAIKCNIDWKGCGVSDVFLCDNAFEAQKVIETNDIDLVISDVQMPGMDGLDLGRWIKEFSPATAIIFVSGYAEFEYAQTAVTLGAEEYILKPVKYPELQERIKRCIDIRKKEKKQKLDIDFKRFAMLLEKRDTAGFEELMESAIESIYIDGRVSRDLLHSLYNYFIQIIYSYIGASFESRFFLLQDEKLTALEKNSFRSVDGFRKYYKYFLDKLQSNQDSKKSKHVIQDVVKYIDSHIGEKVSRSELAKLVFYNECYLSRRFHEEIGCSISTYIMQKRLEVSKQLLTQTKLSVTEIGDKVGYDSTAYFIRIFKQQTGKTPNEFRKDLRN